MNLQKSTTQSQESDFTEFWNNFQPLPFKWANPFINKSRYLFLSVAFVYMLLALLTFFPSLGGHYVKVLESYPSLNIILVGWMAVIALSVRWRHKIPGIFQWLLESERLGPQNNDLEKEYLHFLHEYQATLLSKKDSLLFGLASVILFSLMAAALKAVQFLFFLFTPTGNILIIVVLVIVMFWLFLIGLVGQLIIVTSTYIGKLTQRFSVQLQPSHPDGCGGLKPLGDFCFSVVLPLVIGGLFLTLIPVLRLDNMYTLLAVAATFALFLIAGPLTILTILLALWNIHSDMVEHKRLYADQIGAQIKSLEGDIMVNTSGQGDLAKAKTAKEKLEILQTLRPDRFTYPVWPFKVTSTALLIFSPQILQTLIGAATTIYTIFFK